MHKTTSAAVLDQIADTLVLQEKYANKEDALRALARTAVRAKIARYWRRIRRFQRKYSMDFTAFFGFSALAGVTATASTAGFLPFFFGASATGAFSLALT